jgi:hypothetical protein
MTDMKIDRLYEILDATTAQYRKGPEIIERREGPLEVVEVFAMPHIDEVFARDDIVKVDVHFMVIGVDAAKAAAYRDELIEMLRSYPQPDRLAGGPSYIEMGAAVGDQGAALRLFALGQVLKFWSVVTPAAFGLKGKDADDMAGVGYVMITGWRDRPSPVP